MYLEVQLFPHSQTLAGEAGRELGQLCLCLCVCAVSIAGGAGSQPNSVPRGCSMVQSGVVRAGSPCCYLGILCGKQKKIGLQEEIKFNLSFLGKATRSMPPSCTTEPPAV